MTRGPLSSPSGAGWSGGTGYVGEGEKDRAKGRAWGVAARRVRPSVKSGVVADRGVTGAWDAGAYEYRSHLCRLSPAHAFAAAGVADGLRKLVQV